MTSTYVLLGWLVQLAVLWAFLMSLHVNDLVSFAMNFSVDRISPTSPAMHFIFEMWSRNPKYHDLWWLLSAALGHSYVLHARTSYAYHKAQLVFVQ